MGCSASTASSTSPRRAQTLPEESIPGYGQSKLHNAESSDEDVERQLDNTAKTSISSNKHVASPLTTKSDGSYTKAFDAAEATSTLTAPVHVSPSSSNQQPIADADGDIVSSKSSERKRSESNNNSSEIVDNLSIEDETIKDDYSEDDERPELTSGRIAMYELACITHIGSGDPPIKKENQDVVYVESHYGGIQDTYFVCCLDGHGQYGKLIAEFTMDWLRTNVKEMILRVDPRENDETWAALLVSLFSKCEQELISNEDIGFRSKMSGTTATLAIISHGRIHVANVGDSRGLLVRPNINFATTRRVSHDHRPEDPDERARIELIGGVIRPSARALIDASQNRMKENPPLRVWLSDEKSKSMGFMAPGPGLMLTRSLGDAVAKEAGCTHEPSISHAKFEVGSIYVAASDGLW